MAQPAVELTHTPHPPPHTRRYPRDASSTMPIMGYSMTTADNIRFTAWVEFNYTTNTTDWAMSDDCDRCALEMYNHTSDPDENMNLAYHTDMVDEVAKQFEKLKAGWRSSYRRASKCKIDSKT